MGMTILPLRKPREDILVLLSPPSGPTKYRSTVVGHYIVEDSPPTDPSMQLPSSPTAHITVSGAFGNKDDEVAQCIDDFSTVSFDVLISGDQFPPSA